jgi:hypothetical protein
LVIVLFFEVYLKALIGNLFVIFLFHIVITFCFGKYFVQGSEKSRRYVSFFSFIILVEIFQFFPEKFVFLYSRLYLSLFVFSLFSFNFFFGFKTKKKMFIYFFVHSLPYFLVLPNFNIKIPERIETPIFLYVKPPAFMSKPKFSNIGNIRIQTAQFGEVVVGKSNIYSKQERINFEFIKMPKMCGGHAPYSKGYSALTFEEKLLTEGGCSYGFGDSIPVCLQASFPNSSNTYCFMFFPRADIGFLKKVFLINEFEFVMNFNNYMFHFDAKKGALSFIGEGEILFACPAEDIISITKETENGIISLPHIP